MKVHRKEKKKEQTKMYMEWRKVTKRKKVKKRKKEENNKNVIEWIMGIIERREKGKTKEA